MQRFASLLAVAALAATASAQFNIVVPNGFAAAEGSTSNAFPWGRGGTGLLHQCVYDSSHFTLQGVTYPILITGLKWRPNTNVALVATTYPTACSVRLSTCPVDWNSTTTTLASNRGADETLCFQGPVTFPAQAAVAGPTPFGINIPLTTSFLYDPNLGDLNIECDLPVQVGYVGGTPQLDVHGTAGQANASRIYWSTGYTGYPGVTATGRDANHAVVVEVTYTPAAGLYSGFNANVTGGASPLAVNFTDTTYTSDPGGVTSWAWDFDGDNVIDSNLQNPSFVYNSCGNYTVSLTTTDATHPPSTLTRTAYIKTDEVVPSFTVALVGPATYQFTDTSVPTPTSWAWDLDGDNVTDSTLQNPTWVYTNPCSAPIVKLTVNRLCKGPFSTSQGLLVSSVSSQSTVFTGGNGLSAPGSGNTFDITVSNPAGINIYALTVAPYMAAPVIGTPLACTVWITDAAGGYLANHTNAAVWRQVATGVGVFAGGTFTAPVPVNMSLSNPIYVPPGTFGMAIHMTGGSGVAYTNVTAPFTYPGADVSITCGNGKGAPFSTTANAGRAWNGTLHYSLPSNCGLAGYGFFGAGCAGALGITHVTNSTRPVIGGTLNTTLDNLEFGIAVMVIGLSNTVSGGIIPLPLDLGVLGAPGCNLRASLDVTDTVVGVGNTANWSFSIPNNGALLGFQLYNQAAPLSSTNAFGFVTSDAYAWLVGN